MEEHKRVDTYQIALDRIRNHTIITNPETHTMYIFNGKIFSKTNAKAYIRSAAEIAMGSKASVYRRNEVEKHIKAMTYEFDSSKFEHPSNLLVCGNKFIYLDEDYNIHEGLPKNGNPFIFIPTEYHEDAKCPKFDKFMSEVLRPEDIPLMWEIIGYCLFPQNNLQKMFIFYGSGANGKDKMLNVIAKLLGKWNVEGIQLSALGKDKYVASRLQNKLVNLAGELSPRALRDTSTLKQLSGESLLYANEKYKSGTNFYYRGKLIFATNDLPESYDDSYGFYRRMITIDFPNTFVGENCDIHILDKIATKEELEGILVKALHAYIRLMKRKRFCRDTDGQENRINYLVRSNMIKAFAEICLEDDEDNEIEKRTVYNRYVAFCKKHGRKHRTDKGFFKLLKNYITYDTVRHRQGDTIITYLVGIKCAHVCMCASSTYWNDKRDKLNKLQLDLMHTRTHAHNDLSSVSYGMSQEERMKLIASVLSREEKIGFNALRGKLCTKGYPPKFLEEDLKHLKDSGRVIETSKEVYSYVR